MHISDPRNLQKPEAKIAFCEVESAAPQLNFSALELSAAQPAIAQPDIAQSAVSEPALLEAESPMILGETRDETSFDASAIVEQAEEILREGRPHDFDVLVIGGGPGGYIAAIRAAQLGAHVGLIEERELGGVCLNRGCIPTKTLLETVDVMRLFKRARDYGITLSGDLAFDFARMNAHKREVIADLRAHVTQLLEENGVEVLSGRARFIAEHTVEVSSTGNPSRQFSAVHIILAVGSLPSRLPVEGADLPGVITSDELLGGEVVPREIVVIGGGAVGVEFAYLFAQMGAPTLLMERSPRLLPTEDEDIARAMTNILSSLKVRLATDAELKRIEQTPAGLEVVYAQNGEERRSSTQSVLMAAGRRANTDGLGLDDIGLKHENGKIEVDEQCQTNIGGVYAIGDCTRDAGWAHLASGEGKMVAEIVTKNPVTVDLRHVPSCYYTHPEIASVGLTREQAEKEGLAIQTGVFHFRQNGRAASAGEHEGFVKIVADNATNKILGCQIIGPRATDLISEAVMALKNNLTIEEMAGAIHAHPTFSEAIPEAALNVRKIFDDE